MHGPMPKPMPSNTQALQQRYTEPPRSLADAASRAWRPIRRRDYVFTRRAAKAEFVGGVRLGALLCFYDARLAPTGPQQRRLCVQVWGGAARRAAATAGEAAAEGGGAGAVEGELRVVGEQVAAFKACLPAYPVTDVLLALRPLPVRAAL